MRQVFEQVDYIAGSEDVLANMQKQPAMRIFDGRVTAFLRALSGEILKSAKARRFPDAVTFAFWCRKANLLLLRKQYDDSDRLGRGVAFHIAPSNVPLNFAYSMAVGMLAGNANVVRLPSKDFEQIAPLCEAITKLLYSGEFTDIAARLCLVKYARDKKTTDALSALCNSRIIWGGDATVAQIRQSPLPPRANEITFSDRYSICLINSDKYLADYDKAKAARDFYNDTYLTDQNACTSPRAVIWLGGEIEKAREIFWASLSDQLEGYELKPAQTVNKLSTFYRFAANSACKLAKADDCKLMRVAVKKLGRSILDNLENSGYFYEYDAKALDEILPLCGGKCQTLSYIGLDAAKLRDFILANAPPGVDRIVPVGRTMDFSLVWDGRDLIRELSRVVAIC
ncbi:MAG: hypothetical protein LBO03_08045 [Acidaminococcales bacterium]|jgi:hypothetical protein|nr:hypothetical protein [Acidaminococcales bacterium]